jgi:Helicase associated domain
MLLHFALHIDSHPMKVAKGQRSVFWWTIVAPVGLNHAGAFTIPIPPPRVAVVGTPPLTGAQPCVQCSASSVAEIVGDANPVIDNEDSVRDFSLKGSEDERRGSQAVVEPSAPLASAGVYAKVGWIERARQLYEFQQQHGHSLVPRRCKENPALGNWVNKQRQQYRNYQAGTKPCSLTETRIDILNQMNFCWDTTTTKNNEKGDQQHWWSCLEELRSWYLHLNDGVQSTSLVHVPRQTKLGVWLDRQRKTYLDGKYNHGTSTDSLQEQLSEKQIASLSDIDPDWWMTRRQWQWETRYRELQDYASCHGDCCVPISYANNKLLANWVSNQRKQYNLRAAGKLSDLTDDRFQRLKAIGFVWNRWEYEFDKKEVDWTS